MSVAKTLQLYPSVPFPFSSGISQICWSWRRRSKFIQLSCLPSKSFVRKKRICACLFLSFIFQDIAAIAGAFIGASNIPERWFPGSLDLVCNSHHIMHVLVVVAAYQMHQAVLQDLAWMTAVSEGKLACWNSMFVVYYCTWRVIYVYTGTLLVHARVKKSTVTPKDD